jgi:putative transposase
LDAASIGQNRTSAAPSPVRLRRAPLSLRHAGLAFLQDRHDLRLAELRLLHGTSLHAKSCQKSPLVECLRGGEAYGISHATFYKWKSKYNGASVAELKRLRELEGENAKLKRMYADQALEIAAIKEVLNRKL